MAHVRIPILALLALAALVSLPHPAAAEQLEMDVITVYGRESYRLRKEVFDLLTPMRKEELSKYKLRKHLIATVDAPVVTAPSVVDYETNYIIKPAGEVPTVSVVRTGILLYFMTRKAEMENLRLVFTRQDGPPDGASQDFYMKRVAKDQYIEIMLQEGRYRMNFRAEGMEPAVADSIVVRAGQISLAIIPVDEIRLPPPPPPAPETIVVAPETVPPPPPVVETPLRVQMVALRKTRRLPEPKPVMVTKGRVRLRETGLANMQVRLYEKEVGFFNDPYDPNLEAALLAVTVTDSYGQFSFPPIDNDDGFLEGTRDLVVVLSLENSQLSVSKPFTMSRSVPYRYVIYQKDNVEPMVGLLEIGEIAANLKKEKPVMLFQAAMEKTGAFTYPIHIIYPAGSNHIKMTRRRIEVPERVETKEVAEYLTYLTR